MDDMQHMFLQAVFTSIPVTVGVIMNFIITLVHKRVTGTDGPSPIPVKDEHKHSTPSVPTGEGRT